MILIKKWLKELKEKFMDDATRAKLSGYQWFTDGTTDIRVSKENIEQFLKDNPTHRRGRVNVFRKKEKPVELVGPAEQKPFDYEEELAQQGLAPSWVEAGKESEPVVTPQNSQLYGMGEMIGNQLNQQLKLHLDEGIIQMRPNQRGSGMTQSDQRRIVWAVNGSEAIQKFSTYFSSLNTPTETYVVVFASVSEEIR